MSTIQTEFQQILTAAKERRGDLSVDSMIVSSHLAQMRMFSYFVFRKVRQAL